jgi:hypothetical protein
MLVIIFVAVITAADKQNKQTRNTMIVKPSIGFLRTVSDARLVTDAETIVNSMTNNSSYPTPSPALAEITTAINDFTVAIANAANGGTDLTAIKNAKRAALAALLRELASYVTVACKGNMADLLTSGFPIQKPTRTAAGVLPAPETPVLVTGARSGDLAAVAAPVANAYTYNWRVALASAPTDYVQEVQTTAARTIFSGLTPGQIYAVDLNAVGSAGPSDWSNAAELMVV